MTEKENVSKIHLHNDALLGAFIKAYAYYQMRKKMYSMAGT
jgi:hypothetical protein